jgi:hypothetical protein
MQASCLPENESQLYQGQLFTTECLPELNPGRLPISVDNFVRLPFRQAKEAVKEMASRTNVASKPAD